MNAPVTITATLPAWITSTKAVDRMLRYVAEGKHTEFAASLFFCSGEMDKGTDPWVRAGEADITVRLVSQDALVANQLQTLQEELNAARAAWLTTQQEILTRISHLQALPNEVVEVPA